MNFVARPYQSESIRCGLDFLRTTKVGVNGLLVEPTGGGKSLILAEIVRQLDGPAIVFQPSAEILDQNFGKLLQFGCRPSIYSASRNQSRVGEITLATIGSVVRKAHLFERFKYILIDECFVPGTLVDGRPIETIKPGQYVTSFDHAEGRVVLSQVEAVIKKPAPFELCCVRIQRESIVSTRNHRYYVIGRGYTEAQNLKYGDSIIRSAIAWQQDGAIPFTRTSLYSLRHGSAVVEHEALSSVEKKRQSLPQGVLGIAQRNLVFGEDVEEKPNEEACCTGKDVEHFETHWPQAKSAWRKRKAVTSATKNAFDIIVRGEFGLVSRVSHSNADPKEGGLRVSDMLQNRHWESGGENRCGNRWHWPPRQTKGVGLEKGQSFEIARVESVEILEQGSCGKYGGCERCDYVYDLQIARHSNYFAAGVLVHNCHVALNPKNEGGMFMQFLSRIKDAKILGLTATPYRLSNDRFGGAILKFLTRTRPRVFHKVVHVTQNGDLLRDGYWANLEYKQVKTGFREDRLRVNSTGADYTDESVRQHFRELNFADQIVRCVERVGELGRGPVLVFTRFVEEAEYVARRCGGAVVTANTPKDERKAIVRQFKAGQIKCVANVSCLAIGFDYPELANVILAAPTRSLARYYQFVGRAVRPHASKDSAFVIDMVGLVEKFGRVEELRLVCGPHDTWRVENGQGNALTNCYFDQPKERVGWSQTLAFPFRSKSRQFASR